MILGPDSRFGGLDGVIRTRVGYAGGNTSNPTYHNLADHTEALQFDYDPETIGFRDLLRHFWLEHRPLKQSWSRQYMSAIFCADAQQFELAHEVKADFERRSQGTIHTEISLNQKFYLAEDYHQKYRLQRHNRIMEDLHAWYPNFADLVNSPTATRLNAFFGGALSKTHLAAEVEFFGLSNESIQILSRTVK